MLISGSSVSSVLFRLVFLCRFVVFVGIGKLLKVGILCVVVVLVCLMVVVIVWLLEFVVWMLLVLVVFEFVLEFMICW